MSLGITKECFPPASKCYNCERKKREDILENPEGRKEFKRCTGCHLLTYCDRDCQREHWQKVHKRHCGFLSGQKLVKNSRHRKENCSLCIEERKSRVSEVKSISSPKSTCYLESMIILMRRNLDKIFDFHEEGKECNCSFNIGCQLPLELGELSGHFVGNGLDEMAAHALKIVKAMLHKDENTSKPENRNETLYQLWLYLVGFRVSLWQSILIYGVIPFQDEKAIAKHLTERVDKLRNDYGENNPWWKALYYSLCSVVHMNNLLLTEFCVNGSLDGQKFGLLKQTLNFDHAQLKNKEFVIKNNLWPVFKMWPIQAGGELVLLLPDGTRCEICKEALTGQFSVIGNVPTSTDQSPPMVISKFGENGQLVVSCSAARKPRCVREMLKRDVRHCLGIDEAKWRKHIEEQIAFSEVSRGCDLCLKQSLSSHRCSACKAAQYCSTQCQGEDLSFHKSVCSTWARDQLRKIGGAKHQKKSYKSKVDKERNRMDEILKEFYEGKR